LKRSAHFDKESFPGETVGLGANISWRIQELGRIKLATRILEKSKIFHLDMILRNRMRQQKIAKDDDGPVRSPISAAFHRLEWKNRNLVDPQMSDNHLLGARNPVVCASKSPWPEECDGNSYKYARSRQAPIRCKESLSARERKANHAGIG